MRNVGIKSIKKIEPSVRYDIEVEDNNNMFANGILVHNCRTITIYNDGEINFYSREGHEFLTLDNLKQSIMALAKEYKHKKFVLDGECCVMNGNLEDFTSIMKEIKKKNHQIENPRYYLFDVLDYNDFINKKSTTTFKQRYETLTNLYGDKFVTALVQREYTEDVLRKLQDQGKKDGWEGLMLRKGNAVYKGKRSRDLLKVKEFSDAEYIVKDIEVGPFRLNTPEGEKTITTLAAVIIEHKGCLVRVGSGFTIDERDRFYKAPNEIIGKTITVKYFSESKNQNGGYSLRFPTFKALHGEKRVT